MNKFKKGIVYCMASALILSASVSGVYAAPEENYNSDDNKLANEAITKLYEITSVKFTRISNDKVRMTINTQAAQGDESFKISVRGPGYMGSVTTNSRNHDLELSNYGYYTIGITATDSIGNTDSVTKTLNFTAPLGLTCNQSSTLVGINEDVAFRANANGGDGNYKYKFTKIYNGKSELIQDFDVNRTININFGQEGEYKIVTEVTDGNGDTSQIEKYVTVVDRKKDKPVIVSENKAIVLGEGFNPLIGVSASDKFDGDITNKIKVIKNTVDTSKTGNYVVIYEVEDNDGNISTKEIQVVVDINILDIKGHWAENTIKTFINEGYVNGYPDSTFKPENTITSAEFVKIFNKKFGLTSTSGKVFSDTQYHWAKNEIDIAVTNGVCQGKSTTEFDPDGYLTREEAAKMIANYKKISDSNHDKLNSYNDYANVSNWAKDAVEGVIEEEYMNGYAEDNTYRPTNNITRAEAVVTLSRVK